MFKADSREIQQSSVPMSPGVHKIWVSSVKAHKTEPREEGGESYDVIDIELMNSAKETNKIRLFNPMNTSDEAIREREATYAAKVIVTFANKIQNKDIELNVSSWEELGKFAEKNIDVKAKVPLLIKLIGNVYNGKARVGITRYDGWLKRFDSGESIKLSQNENKSNAEWDAFVNGAKPSSGAATSTEKDDDLPF